LLVGFIFRIAGAANEGPMRVLVVDDSRVMRNIIVRMLQSLGVTDIVEAGDGNDALNKLMATPYDVVLTDWNMPNRTGLQLTRDLRTLGSRVPIVMITTEAERSHVLEAIQAGVNDYLIKPFEKNVLRNKLAKWGLLQKSGVESADCDVSELCWHAAGMSTGENR
jgi:two-component system, chemotaxis family, chemotaxis protein CheY